MEKGFSFKNGVGVGGRGRGRFPQLLSWCSGQVLVGDRGEQRAQSLEVGGETIAIQGLGLFGEETKRCQNKFYSLQREENIFFCFWTGCSIATCSGPKPSEREGRHGGQLSFNHSDPSESDQGPTEPLAGCVVCQHIDRPHWSRWFLLIESCIPRHFWRQCATWWKASNCFPVLMTLL